MNGGKHCMMDLKRLVHCPVPTSRTSLRKIDRLLAEYGDSHQNATNEIIHWICVPAIFFSILGLIACIPPGPLAELEPWLGNLANWALPAVIVVGIYYVILSPSLALGLMFFSAGCLVLVGFISSHVSIPLWGLCAGIFAVSWVFQFFGHHVEGKKPSFLKDVQFLLIGPAWLMHFIYRKAGLPF